MKWKREARNSPLTIRLRVVALTLLIADFVVTVVRQVLDLFSELSSKRRLVIFVSLNIFMASVQQSYLRHHVS